MAADRRDDRRPGPPTPRWRPWLSVALLLGFLAVLYLWSGVRLEAQPGYEIPYTRFKSLIASDKVAEVRLRGQEAQGRLRAPEALGPRGESSEFFRTYLPPFGDPALLPALEAAGF